MKLRKWIQPGRIHRISLGCIFLLMLLLNMHTLYLADDYTYFFSFADGKPMESVLQIIPSMQAHAGISNGRLIAHSFVQFFAILPRWVFDIVNAGMFMAQIALLCYISGYGVKRNAFFSAVVFSAIWMYQPLFGQVNLWQDGSCNYLWGIVVCLLFLLPFIRMFCAESGELLSGGWKKAGFLLLAFAAGAYYENTSAAAIFIAMLLTAMTAFFRKRNVSGYVFAAILCACMGYISIYMAPAQLENKAAEMSFYVLFQNLIRAVEVYEEFGILLLAYAVMLILNISQRTDLKRNLLSLAFLAGSLAANFIMVFASYYKERTAASAVIFLVAADGIALYSLLENLRYRTAGVCIMAVALIVCIPDFLVGVADIRDNYVRMKNNEAYIYACKDQGKLDIELENVVGSTEQSPVFEIKYLDTESPDEWPNNDMARYYGLNSITAIQPKE